MDPKAFDIVYGIVGLKAAGKGAFGDRMNAAGFATYTLSTPIKVIAEKEVGPDYDVVIDLIRIGNEGRQKHGTGHWAGEMLMLASQAGHRKVVIDGIRNPGEIIRLRELLGERLVLVGVTAPSELRFQRLLKRGKKGDPTDLPSFLEMDDKDRGIGQADDGQLVDRCLAQVPFANIYDNHGTLQQFHEWIDVLHARESVRVERAIIEESTDYID